MGFASAELANVPHIINHNLSDVMRNNGRISHSIRSSLDRIKRVYRSTVLMRVRYDSSYVIGVDEFDGRRQTILGVYNSFNYEVSMLAEHFASTNRLNERVSLLVRLIGEQFSFEEGLMAEINYPELVGHKARHTRFLETLHDEFERIQAGRADMFDLSYLIGSWLTEHMRAEDRLFGNFVIQVAGLPVGPMAAVNG